MFTSGVRYVHSSAGGNPVGGVDSHRLLLTGIDVYAELGNVHQAFSLFNGHGFGEISGLVYVTAPGHGDMIGEQLQGNNGYEG